MADPTQTPEALKRLIERLSNLTPRDSGYAFLGNEAASAIAGLMAERDALITAIQTYVTRIPPDGESNYQLEAYYAVRDAIARSTSQGGEG